MFRRRSQLGGKDSASHSGTSTRSFIRSFLSSSSTAGSLRSRSPSNALDDSLPPYLDLSLPRTDLRVEFGAPGDLPKVVESSSAKVGGDAAAAGGGVGGGGRRGNGVVAAFRKGSAPSSFPGRSSKQQQGKSNGPTKDYLKFELAPVTTDPVPTKSPPTQTDSLMFASARPVTPPWAEEVLAAAPSTIAVDGTEPVASGATAAAAPSVPAVHEGLATPGVTKDAQAGFVVASTPTTSSPTQDIAASDAPQPSSPPSASAPFPTSAPSTPAPAPAPPLSVQATAPPPMSPARTTSFLRNLTPRSLRTKKSHQSNTLQQSPSTKTADLPSPTEAPETPKGSNGTAKPALATEPELEQGGEKRDPDEQATPKPDAHVLVPNVDEPAVAAVDDQDHAHVPNGIAAALTPDTATMNLHSDAGSMQTAEAGAETEIEDAGEEADSAVLGGDSKRLTGQGLRLLDTDAAVAPEVSSAGEPVPLAEEAHEAQPQPQPVEVKKDVIQTVEVEERPEAATIEANGVAEGEATSHPTIAGTTSAADPEHSTSAAAQAATGSAPAAA